MIDPLADLSRFQQEVLAVYTPTQMFAVVSWGCAATSWIAAVLNSHPDIFCVHAANWFWQTLGGAQALDGLPYIRLIGSQGYAHAAAGDVHGVSRGAIPELRAAFGNRFNAVVVIRDPLPRLRSQLALFNRFQPYETWDIDYVDAIIERQQLRLPTPTSYSNRLVVHGANMLNAVIEEQSVGMIYRCEDLTANPEALGTFICDLTRDQVVPDETWLEAAVTTKKLNIHRSGQELAELADWQIEVIRAVVSPLAWELYARFGYQQPPWL